jgi:hypothetical protein
MSGQTPRYSRHEASQTTVGSFAWNVTSQNTPILASGKTIGHEIIQFPPSAAVFNGSGRVKHDPSSISRGISGRFHHDDMPSGSRLSNFKSVAFYVCIYRINEILRDIQ